MAKRGTGIKIKRSKGLYRRKSALRKTLETAALVVVVAGLVFVGFNVAKVLLNYEHKSDDDPVITDAAEDSAGEDNNAAGSHEHTQSQEPPPEENKPPKSGVEGSVAYAPANVASSPASLSSYLKSAKESGFDSVVIEMKDESGRLLYNSGIATAVNAGVNAGTLTAEQIADAVKAEGLFPIARISTLKDPVRIEGVSYDGWIDHRPGQGKPWANPLFDGTKTYIAEITAELYNAGFTNIIFANTMLPKQQFSGEDMRLLPGAVTAPATRFVPLGDFVNAVSQANPESKIFIEVLLRDLGDGSTLTETAEILRNGGDSLEAGGIVLIFSAEDFAGVDMGGPSSGFDSAVRGGLEKVAVFSGKLKIIPLLDGAGLSESDRAAISEAFKTNGYENFIIRN